MNLDSKIKDINKIAGEVAPKMKKLGLETINDLLFYFPFRYDDYSNLLKIKDMEPNVLLTVAGKIELLNARRSFHRKMLVTEAIVTDETGSIKVIWFNQSYLAKILSVGTDVYLSGKAMLTESGLELHNPTFEKINKYDNFTMHTGRLVPIYASTEKLSQRQIRFLMKRVLSLAAYIPDWLDDGIKKSAGLINLAAAVQQIHFPSSFEKLEQARERLKFDEIFLIQARAQLAKMELAKSRAKKIVFQEKATQKFVKDLPFVLMPAQKKAAWEIIKDLGQVRPMNRLLEGDVGSGKTITAGVALYNVLLNGFQAAYMAPTEILAQQQFIAFSKIFAKYNFKIALLTANEARLNTSAAEEVDKKKIIKMTNAGEIDLIIGTHALIQDKIGFYNLVLVIVDEQHRFGVRQRKILRDKAAHNDAEKGFYPHFLSMTATPIPRSLALTLYGDLDLSVIDEMPKNRKVIITKVIEPHERKGAYDFIRSEIAKDHQVFVACPLIDPSDTLGSKAVKEEFERLDKEVFREIKVGLLHGRLKSAAKEKIMREFVENKIKILVSTSVIEVGIDVPNATIMMIESAERFGLAQLHQLRGRVGRAEHQSYCFLFTESDSENTVKRMQAFVTAKNGFELAEKDLEFRGPGEVYGMHQAGFYDSLKIAKLTDWLVIKKVKEQIEGLFKADPDLVRHAVIKNRVAKFESEVHWE